MFKKIALLILSFTSIYAMHTAELNINQYELEAGLKLDVGQYNSSVEPDTTFVGVTFLNAAAENDSIRGDDNEIDSYFDINFMIKQDIQNTGFKIGLGVKSVFITGDYVALPIGLELAYRLPISSPIPISIGGAVHYAPESLSFVDALEYLEYRAVLNFQLMDRASLYVGYRNIDIEGESHNYKYDDTYNETGYIGIKFSF